MNLPPLNAAALLRQHGLRPDKSLGQNFLQDPAALEKIVQAAELCPNDWVLEIGPGVGSLTRYLAISAQTVIAVELDTSLLPILKTVLAPYPNTHIIEGNILHVSPATLSLPEGYLVVANIPYYITSAIFRHLLETPPRPRRIVLTIQKEVAQRICAAPGEMSLLALSVQVYGQPRLVAHIPAGAFYPAPKVDSAVIRVDLYPQPLIDLPRLERFFQLARAGFSQKRKTLRNSLSAGLKISANEATQLLKRAGLDPMRRAETLSIEEWRMLTERE
ncbi:MAG: ribosomal RNA small subunit methyltransferase A [Anaerolineae bacterium]|nr:MAG: ribosomal RNA small subunit methyltransferase A [Anaerolineae bacterium]